MTVPGWLACPNTPPCGHAGLFHDIGEPGDPRPTCCIGDCRCGQPTPFVAREWPPESVTTAVGDMLKTRRTPGLPDLPDLSQQPRRPPEYRVIPVDPLAALRAAVDAWQQLPRVVVSVVVPLGTMVVVEPHPDLPTVDRRTIALNPGDAHRIRTEHPLLALELGFLGWVP